MARTNKRWLAACLALLAASVSAQTIERDLPPLPGTLLPRCVQIHAASVHPAPAQVLTTQEQGVADASIVSAADPFENIATLRSRLREYYDCADQNICYWKDVDAQLQRATRLMESSVAKRHAGEKLAIVLDIDETSLTSYCEEIREDFGYLHTQFESWIVSPNASIPLPGTVELVQRARALSVDVFFITGRPESQRAATEANLRAAGYEGWKHLSLVQPATEYPSSTPYHSAIPYKSAERQKILEQGYRIVLNVGDQWSDLLGPAKAENSVKLPNPFYYLP